MKEVLIINGYPRAGKTLMAALLKERAKVMERSSIDLVKEISEEYYGRNREEKTPEYRKFLSDTKHFLIQETDLIEQDLDRAYHNFLNDPLAEFLLIDIREPEEIEKYSKRYDAKSVFIDRADAERDTSNISDASVEKYDYDYELMNPGTMEEYRKIIDEFYVKLQFREIE